MNIEEIKEKLGEIERKEKEGEISSFLKIKPKKKSTIMVCLNLSILFWFFFLDNKEAYNCSHMMWDYILEEETRRMISRNMLTVYLLHGVYYINRIGIIC